MVRKKYLIRSRDEFLCGVILIAAGIALRLRQLACFEFKDDQARLVLNGLCALRDLFCVTFSQPGSSGIPNPAGGAIFAGVIALFGTSPMTFAAGFVLLSILTIAGVYWALLPVLGRQRTWFCTVLTGISPVLIWNASNLWGPGLLIFFTALFLRGIARYTGGGNRMELILAGTASALGAWIFHLSALFLFPGMIYAAVKRKPCRKELLALTGIGLLLFGPWINGLLFRWDHVTHTLPSSVGEKLQAWIWNLASFGNGLFFREYFPFPEWPGNVIAAAVCSACLAALLFYLGVRHRIRNRAEQTALLLTAVVPVLYLLLGFRVYPHYFMVILLPVNGLCARGLMQFPGRLRCMVLILTGAAMLGVTLYWQNRVLKGNGHWYEFGPSGNYLESIASELDGDTIWNLRITADNKAGRKLDPIAATCIFDRHMQKNGTPKRLILRWNDAERKFIRALR